MRFAYNFSQEMSEDTDPSDDTDFLYKAPLADEAFVIAEAIDRFGSGGGREIVVGPGDDAAVLDFGGPEFLVDSCDCMVEGVHFRKEWLKHHEFGARAVGAKAVLCAASDIAAMGAAPKTVLVSAGLPPQTRAAVVVSLLDGVARGCETVGAVVAGGNTSSSPAMFVDVKITGETAGRGFVRNSGAEEGDGIFVTGQIGCAAAGLVIFEKMFESGARAPDSRAREMVEKFHFPHPRIRVGLALVGVATAMADLSDGLLSDLRCITSSSGVGAEVFFENLPVSPGFAGGPASALTAGGDYELVFTAPERCAEKIREISKKTAMEITNIGRVTKGGEVRLFDSGREVETERLGAGGFVHNSGKA